MYQIDTDVPLPPSRHKYPMKELAIGQSFFVQDPKLGPSLHSSATFHKIKIAIRKERDGLRVWRVS